MRVVKNTVTGLWAVKPGSGGRGYVTKWQVIGDTSARHGGGYKNAPAPTWGHPTSSLQLCRLPKT